jgi:tRNA(Ile)-lysidine synthase
VTAADPASLLRRCTFPEPGTEVVCAVSGGADSLALLVLAVAAGCRVTAVHVDHGLRPGSAQEAEVVRAAADRFGAGFRAVSAPVADGPNLEARARAARLAALPADARFGHTADDQAETVLLHLLRGSGLTGLGGIRDRTRHPILDLRRSETRALCAASGLEPVVDPSNDDPRHRRNRVRHEVLPLLDDVADRDVVPLLARFADLAGASVALLEDLAAGIDASDAATLRALPVPLASVAVRRWLRDQTGAEHPPPADAVDRVLAVAALEVRACELPGGWRVSRHGGRLAVGPVSAEDDRPVRLR